MKTAVTELYPLFEHMSRAHGLTLVETELDDIIRVVDKMRVKTGDDGKVYRLACDACRCGWRGDSSEMLKAVSPFDDAVELHACPYCRMSSTLRTCCDEPGCWEQDTIGMLTAGGYRRTCHEHMPKKK